MKSLARQAAVARGALQPRCPTGRLLSTSAAQHHRLIASRKFNEGVNSKSNAVSKGSPEINAKIAARSRANAVSDGPDPETRLRLGFGKRYTGRHGVFRSTVLHRFQHVLQQLSTSSFSVAGIGQNELRRQAALFMDVLDDAFELAEQNITKRGRNSLFWNMREAFITRDVTGLTKELQYSFQSFVVRQRFSKTLEDSQKKLLDLRFPHEWFPATRAMQRTIHVHVGPTNSGKTYHALKALENSKSGIYAGPLRLLANEVYQRLNSKGLPCALITGEEIRIPQDTDQYFTSCTVEMVPLNLEFDVVVIDEIQMLADEERGYGWTSALLGVQAKEVHVCGEERTVKLLQEICASIGDKCIIHRYERLSPLATMTKAVDSDLQTLQKGDCVVAFSRLSLHVLKRKIESRTGRRCAIVYGNLPPEVRVQQAALFNDPDNDYDYIVASDAIGMGLNLDIRRVIFESVTKFDGSQNRLLTYPEIKQIGGRAGRYRTARNATEGTVSDAELEDEKIGYVTTLDQADLHNVRRAFTKQVDDIESATIQPPETIVERFASYYPPETPLSFILMRIKAAATVNPRYSLSISSSCLEISDAIQDIPLTIYDRIVFSRCPVSMSAKNSMEILRALATIVATNSNGDLLSIKEIPLELLDLDIRDYQGTPQSYLFELESLHVAINQYLWLSYRYSGTLRSQTLAFQVRSQVEIKLVDSLERLDFTEKQIQNNRRKRRLQAQSREVASKIIRQSHGGGADEYETDEAALDDGLLDGSDVQWQNKAEASAAPRV